MASNPKLVDWAGRNVWVIGASSGIGRAVAELLHRRGAHVAVSARKREGLDSLAEACPNSTVLPLDVSDRDAVSAAADRLFGQHGRLDLVVYCAGHYQAMRAASFDLDEALRHVQVNQLGALHVLDAVLPRLLRQRGGHLSLVASVAGYRGLPNALAYGPTKAALINLAEALYVDLAPLGVGVSVVNPGFVETPLTASNRFRMPALITPQAAAAAMLDGWSAGRFEIHFPRRFTLAMKTLRLLPDRLYFGLVRRALGA
jgi:NAD(P)-dependent dehydrogenase (short-subunit alcohol dehydrogenase family)